MTKKDQTMLAKALKEAARVVIEYRCPTCTNGVARLTVTHAGTASRAALGTLDIAEPACPQCRRPTKLYAVATPRAVYIGGRRLDARQMAALHAGVEALRRLGR